MDLTIRHFNSGWVPSDDDYNGRQDGLLIMDNLKLDENNVLSITQGVRGFHETSLPAPITAIYSKTIGDVKHRFVSLANGQILVSNSGEFQNLFFGTSSNRATFFSGLGHVFICQGSQRQKYDGVRLTDITPAEPHNPPAVQEASKADFMIMPHSGLAGFTALDGSNFQITPDGLEFDTLENVGVIHNKLTTSQNSMLMNNGENGTPYDTFHFWIFANKPQNIINIRVVIYLEDTIDPLTNYYAFDWAAAGNGPLNLGSNTWTHFYCVRHEFQRHGNTEGLDWNTFWGVRIIIEVSDVTHIKFINGGMLFSGSTDNTLTGIYEYMQVNVSNTGTYLAKSIRSQSSPPITLINGRALITPYPTPDPQVQEYWIYRRDATWRSDVIPRGGVRKLDRWYRVAVRTDTTPFEDGVSDEDAMLEGVVYDEGPESLMYIDEEIKGATNLWNNRIVYMTEKFIMFSAEFDPGLVYPIWNLQVSGSNTEKNLWIKNTSMNQILLGTTEDIYEITGTAAALPDGTLDIRVTPIGTGFPPIHEAAVVFESGVIYVAKDGVRIIGGGNYKKLSSDLDMLYYGLNRHTIPAIDVKLYNTGFFGLAVAKDKLYFLVTHVDSTRSVLVYEFKYNHWRRWTTQPYYIYAEEDGNLLLGYGGIGGNYVRYLQPLALTEEGDPPNGMQYIRMMTTFNYNGQSRNRKDAFTLKVTADTDGVPVKIYLSVDFSPRVLIADTGFTGRETKQFTIADKLPLGFRYSLIVEGYAGVFRFYEFTIEYQPLPEQLTYFHLGYTNFGTHARKRIAGVPIIIDPLNGSTTMEVFLDGTSVGQQQITLNRKGTFIYSVTQDYPFTDLDFILSSDSPFEYFGIAESDLIIEKLPPPVKFIQLQPIFDDGIKRRVRTIPFKIDTRGGLVTFTPRVDGQNKPTSVFYTANEPRTVYHYFDNSIVGVDYSGTLSSDDFFEFYKLGNVEVVETFPMFKTHDQVGPTELRQVGRILGFRIMVNPLDNTEINYILYGEDTVIDSGTIAVTPNLHEVYTVNYLPKTIKATVLRMELSADSPFHRYWVEFRINLTGNDTESEIIKL